MVETYTLNPNLTKTAAVAEWLQQVFSDIPHHRSPGVGTLPRDWIRNDKMEWAIRQVTQQADSFIYDYGNVHGYLPLRQQLGIRWSLMGQAVLAIELPATTGLKRRLCKTRSSRA